MTFYSTSDNHREKYYFWIAVLSALLSSVLLVFNNKYIHAIIAPSGFVVYGLLVLLVDKILWKTKVFYFFFGVPNLNGKWAGDNIRPNLQPERLDVTITQTWRKIDVVVKTATTISHVISASLDVDNPNNKQLKYIWMIKPTMPTPVAGAVAGTTPFNNYGEGCTELRIKEVNGKIELEGNYFSSKLSSGGFTLTR